ncbi:hypothetical protein [Acinetobacter baumannii]|uniref:hypothetical protein n=1 Tax=Acinetobacter baumannii TaxID=470 RepID=UPI003891FF40
MFGNQNMQNDGNKTIKLILTIGLVTAALIASAGVFYYYVIFAPNIEKEKLETEKQQIRREQYLKEEQAVRACIKEVAERHAKLYMQACQLQQSKEANLRLLQCKQAGIDNATCLNIHDLFELNAPCNLPEEQDTVLKTAMDNERKQCRY